MKGSALAVVIVIIAIIAVIGMVGFIFFKSFESTQTTSVSNSPSGGVPQASVKDFAPSLPMSQKTTILIQTSDSTEVKYIVPTGQVSTYVKSLPPGYHVVSTTP